MSLFSSGKQSYLGVDIGSGSIKLVELSNFKGRAKLETYGYLDIVSGILKSNSPAAKQQIIEVLKKLKEKSGAKADKCIAALPNFSVFSSIISLPNLPKKDLTQAIKWEAKKYVPLPIEEMILDWKILGDQPTIETKDQEINQSFFTINKEKEQAGQLEKNKNSPFSKLFSKSPEKKKFVKILITAAPKNLVSRYLEIFKAASLNLLSLETEAFALARCLIGHDQSTVMVVDIGAVTTDICIIEKGVPILNRSLDIAGATITKMIAASLNINLERAEQFKRDFGVSISDQGASQGVSQIIEEALNPIINEVKYIFDLYQKPGEKTIEKIILAGGSVFLPNLVDYFAKLFGIKVFIGNAWERVIYPVDLQPVLEEVGSRLAVAIGLALREIY